MVFIAFCLKILKQRYSESLMDGEAATTGFLGTTLLVSCGLSGIGTSVGRPDLRCRLCTIVFRPQLTVSSGEMAASWFVWFSRASYFFLCYCSGPPSKTATPCCASFPSAASLSLLADTPASALATIYLVKHRTT